MQYVISGNLEEVKKLIKTEEFSADLDIMLWAIESKNVDLIRFLVNSGFRNKHADRELIGHCILTSSVEMLEYVIGVFTENVELSDFLLTSAIYDNVEAFKFLYERCKVDTFESYFRIALVRGNQPLVEYLVEIGGVPPKYDAVLSKLSALHKNAFIDEFVDKLRGDN